MRVRDSRRAVCAATYDSRPITHEPKSGGSTNRGGERWPILWSSGMSEVLEPRGVHPQGEAEEAVQSYPAPHKVETVGGMVEVRWEPEPGMTMI